MSLETTGNFITYEDYRKIDDQKRYEVIYGELIMVPAPASEHQHYSRNLQFLIWDYVKRHSLGEVYNAPFDVILDESNVVQPDIFFLKKDNLKIIKKVGIFGVPDLMIEIISPSSKYRDTFQKKDLYEKFRVKEYWIVDPRNRNIEIFILNKNNKYELYSEGYLDEDGNKTVISKEIKGLEINLEEVFEKSF